MPKDPSPCELEPTSLPVWSIYKLAAKRQWLGIVGGSPNGSWPGFQASQRS
jgi:hypothetical protein